MAGEAQAPLTPLAPESAAAAVPMGGVVEPAIVAEPAHRGRLDGLKRLLASLLKPKQKAFADGPAAPASGEPPAPSGGAEYIAKVNEAALDGKPVPEK